MSGGQYRTGRDVRRMRERLGLDPYQFAQALGVSVATVYRWEHVSGVVVRSDQLRCEMLDSLYDWCRRRSRVSARILGFRLKRCESALAAAATLLNALTE